MTSFFIIFFLCFTFNNLNHSEASHHNKNLPSAVVVGTVFCDTCLQEDFSKNSHFISGASVSVDCRDDNSRIDFRKEVKTNEHGEFQVHLPFSVSKHVKKIKKCSVKLLTSSEPYCSVASTATSSSLHLKSRKQGIHIFTSGFFSFKPQKQPNLCNQKPRNSKEFNSQKIPIPPLSPISNNPIFPPPLQDPTIPNLPPVIQSPLPPLPLIPILPPLPQIPPLPPLSGTTTTLLRSEQESGPNFFFPTPPIFPPNPFQPPPILPPNPFQPPPAPLIPLPPIPFLTPPPPPPIIPFPPFPSFPPLPPLPPFPPLPPLPFPPLPPRIPGIPPASSSSSSISQKTSP